MTRVQEKILNILRGGFSQEDMTGRKSTRGYAELLKYYGVIP